MSTMRVLLVGHAHAALSPGGAEYAAHDLFRGLAGAAGVAVSFAAAAQPPDVPPGGVTRFSSETEYLFDCTGFDRFTFSQRSQPVVGAFVRLLDELAPDIVHFHHYLNVGRELIDAAKNAPSRPGVVLTLHDYLAICHNHGVMLPAPGAVRCLRAVDAVCAACFPRVAPPMFASRRATLQAMLDGVDALLAPSNFLRNRYVDWGQPAGRIRVVENGIGPANPPPPRPLAAGEGRARFAFFGQTHPFKGLHDLLQAFEHLATEPPRAGGLGLTVHGAYLDQNAPAYVARIRAMLARHPGLVRFAGPYARGELRRLMAEIDWVVIPSIWWENAPLVIEEALAHRRPVICSGIGGMAERVRAGLDGLHAPVGDPAALAALLRYAADDATLWDRLRGTMRRPVGIDAVVRAHLALYRGLR